jgi:putative DNA primase/helicase
MLAEVPGWLQDWARNRSDATPPANDIIAALGEPPEHIGQMRLASLDIATRIANAPSPWSAHDEARLRSALTFVSPVERKIWLRVGMAIHHAAWGARGYAIWRDWAQTAPEKYDDADQVRTWESFNRTSHDGPCVTLASVFRLAIERGWTSNPKIQNQSSDNVNSQATNDGESKNNSASDGANSTSSSSGQSENRTASDNDDDEIRRLAKLSLLEYERERKDAAERLNMRASILDRLVAAERDKFKDDDKQGHSVNLPEPEPWPEPVDGAELLDVISASIRRHIVMPDFALIATALWVVHTYLLAVFGISPRLAITSPEKQCGKTTLLDVLSRLVWRALTTANASAAAIFRVVELLRPTLLIDEADTFLPENEELRGILNSGHRQGGAVIRTVGEDFEPRSFSTYSACVIALIGRLPATLADRSVHIELRRRRADEAIERFRFDRTDHLDQLARKAARWARDNADRIRSADPEMPEGVVNRAADNWRPLLAIADAAGGEWPAHARQAVQCTGASETGDDQSARVLLLTDIRAVFAERKLDRIPSAVLVAALNSTEGRPWAEWHRGKGLTPNSLARMLAPFQIAPASVRMSDGTTPKGYLFSQFEDAFARYLPNGQS